MPKQKRQSHQTKALLLKNIKLQYRQPFTNLCQIFTPIICLIFTILIRKIAVDNIPDNDDSILLQLPMLPMIFNDFTFEDMLPQFVDRRCPQWYNFQISNQQDRQFIGNKDSLHPSTGLLSKIFNTSSTLCKYNLSYEYPYHDIKLIPPVFIQSASTVNEQIMQVVQYFNKNGDYDETTSIDKIPDGSITFIRTNSTVLMADLKINDQRILDYHRINGITRIRVRSNKTNKYNSFYPISQGLLTLQHIITSAYIEQTTKKKFKSGIMYMPFLTKNSIIIDLLVNTITVVLFPVSLSLLLPVFLYLLVLEKQEKLVQMMKMNGMRMRSYWLVNFLFNFGMNTITNLIFFGLGFILMDNPLFTHTGIDVVIVVSVGWILAQIGMATLLQVFIKSNRAANIVGYLVSIWTNLIGATLSIALYQYPRQLPKSLLLYPTFAFNRLFYLIFTECQAGKCFNKLSALSSEAIQCIFVLYCSFVVFQCLGMYLHEVIPQQFGRRRSFGFPFYAIKNRLMKNDKHKLKQEIVRAFQQNQDELAKQQTQKVANLIDQSHYPLILSNLTKVYSNGKKAVKGIDLIIPDRQVFGLLGPNGAGKTTLISMIIGIFQPTSGECTIGGYNIADEMEQVYFNIGVCPQFDILWPELTVEEHLQFYTRLRGTQKQLEKSMVEKALKQVNLTDFKKFKASQLSGGMKRRLSVGICMVGNPRIVFLDEPTTGLDPQNRRNLWEILHKCRQNRALFITTHLMEEADTLCNRVGIMTEGVLRTVGTQQELKKIYGKGYHLCINIESQKVRRAKLETSHDEVSMLTQSLSSLVSLSDKDCLSQTIASENKNRLKIEQIISLFPQAKLLKRINGYLKFNLGQIKISEAIKKISQKNENNMKWALTSPTLQDAFLEVISKFDKIDMNQKYSNQLKESHMFRSQNQH